MLNLNSLVDLSSVGTSLTMANGINDSGQIIASGANNRAYLLSPLPTPPTIDVNSVGFHTNCFGFNVGGAAGSVVIVEGSTDLMTWLPLATNTLGSGAWYYSDSQATNFQARFYRVASP
jgi:hypothetical protein